MIMNFTKKNVCKNQAKVFFFKKSDSNKSKVFSVFFYLRKIIKYNQVHTIDGNNLAVKVHVHCMGVLNTEICLKRLDFR